MGSALAAGISKIDELIEALKTGVFWDAPASAQPPVPEADAQPAVLAAAQPAVTARAKKAPKPAKTGGGGGGGGAAEGVDLFQKAHIAVAHVVEVKEHPSSDKLYITQLDIGGGARRQVVAGLRKHVAADALQGSCVAVVLNLKAARLAGEASEGMILAAVAPQVTPPQERGCCVALSTCSTHIRARPYSQPALVQKDSPVFAPILAPSWLAPMHAHNSRASA